MLRAIFDVDLFLIGMMLLAGLGRQSGLFDWLAAATVRLARGSARRLFLLVYLAGVVVTVVLSNDATAVVLTPAILAAARRAKVDPLPHLFACVLVSNAASFVLPISNPANLVLYGGQPPALFAWLRAYLLPSLASIAVTYLALRLVFRRSLAQAVAPLADPRAAASRVAAVVSPAESAAPSGESAASRAGAVASRAAPSASRAESAASREAVDRAGATDGPLPKKARVVLAALAGVVALLVAASALHFELGPPTCAAALACALFLSRDLRPLLRELSWGTLLLVAALFFAVGLARDLGLLAHAARWLSAPPLVLGAAVGLANNVFNNLPVGLVAGETLRTAHATGDTVRAALIGVDLGPNLALSGSLASLLWLAALKREGLRVSFWQFLKVGLCTMPPALLAALLAM